VDTPAFRMRDRVHRPPGIRALHQIAGKTRAAADGIRRRLQWIGLTWNEPHGKLFFSQFGEDAYLQRYYASKAWQATGDATRLQTGFYVDVGAFAPKTFSNTSCAS
jgi:hypothetical protein